MSLTRCQRKPQVRPTFDIWVTVLGEFEWQKRGCVSWVDSMWRLIGVNVAVLVVLLVLTEAALAWLGTRSAPLGIGLLDKVARKLYWANLSVVQFEPDCAKYDAELGYTLRPGTCVFESPIFSTEIAVNSAGLRDDEASLDAPRIIVLGDSQAMGWGVEDGHTFADYIELETGERTLNAGVSSYGTARELLMLSRLDTSNLETVIVQYSDNDAWENRAFLSTESLEAMSQDAYQSMVDENAVTANSGFGRYLTAFARIFYSEIVERSATSSDNWESGDQTDPTLGLSDHDVFLELLSSWSWGTTPPRLVILEVNNGGRGGGFIPALKSSPRLAKLQLVVREVVILNTFEFLGSEDFLFPDGHLTPQGQQKIAGAVTEALSALD